MAASNKSSVSNTRSNVTSASSVNAARARAKAEAAKVRTSYASQEAKLKLEKAAREAERKTREAQSQLETARIDTELEVLTLNREADAAIAEAQVLEDVAEMHGNVENVKSESEDRLRLQRIIEYVCSQNDQNQSTFAPVSVPLVKSVDRAESQDSFRTWHPPASLAEFQHSNSKPKPEADDGTHPPTKSLSKLTRVESKTDIERTNPRTYIGAQSQTPRHMLPVSVSQPPDPLAQYLARRDLVTSGLYQFDDKPENFHAWRSSFTNAVAEVQLTETQELDLMTKWLGNESEQQIRSIRSVHVNDAGLALRKAWERLNDCYGAPEMIEQSLFQRLDSFPKIVAKDYIRLRELGDLLMEIQGTKEDGYLTGLSYLDTSRGIGPIVDKLPYGLQEKWVSSGSWYKEENNGRFPPFSYFCNFVCHEARKRNDPSFIRQSNSANPTKPERLPMKSFNTNKSITVHKTHVSTINNDPNKNCPLHNKPHPLKKCRTFRNKSIDDRKAFLKQKGICFKCCSSTSHVAKDCKSSVKCLECESIYHDAAMHPGPQPQLTKAPPPPQENGGEGEDDSNVTDVRTSCTEVCGPGQWGRSCSKICLANVYPKHSKQKAIKAYVILDDQSNRSLARPEFFELFGVENKPLLYHLRTCSGVIETYGRKAEGFQIESLDGNVLIPLPPLLECPEISNNQAEIQTPGAVLHQPHLHYIAKHIPDLDPEAKILLLIGRDVLRAHKVRQQVNGAHNAPFAQCLDLGWVVIGEVCLGNVHKPTVDTFKTHVLDSRRHSIFQPCASFMHVKETQPSFSKSNKMPERMRGHTVFNQSEHDNKSAPSIEDTLFLEIMDTNVHRDDTGSWVAPLLFKEPRQRLPNNREHAVKRFESLQRQFRKKPEMQKQYLEFMEKIIANSHTEVAPPLREDEECWFLPSFGVYHPQKPNQIRVVFDSSAQYCGVSLNDVPLTGPDLNNSLLGVLLRFRRERVTMLADIQQMFHCFLVHERHRNFLRFLWYEDNDLSKAVIDYRMRVHVFGNSPSPAKYGADTVKFVERHFYVDDGLVSLPSDAEAIDLLQRTRASLAESNLRLHKFVSYNPAVTGAFPQEDCVPLIKDLDLSGETAPMQRSLVVSTVNSVFDPMGMLAPVTIQGRALLRELSSELTEWDAPLPEDKLKKWETWRESLQVLKELHVPHAYTSTSLTIAAHTELCVFLDASTMAIGAIAYLRAIQEDGKVKVGFVMGRAKLAPQSEPIIPRLELCAAVLAVEMADVIREELDLKLDAARFYMDSKVVLGYISNTTKCFYTYVHNRVQRIRQSTRPEQWHYVHTEENPADHASRSLPSSHLVQSSWFTRPSFLHQLSAETTQTGETFELIDPGNDSEIRPQVRTCTTHLEEPVPTPDRFRPVAFLIHVARSHKHSNQNSRCTGWHICRLPRTVDEIAQAKHVILQAAQRPAFAKELSALQANKVVPTNSPLHKLSPTLESSLICVGGRLKHSQLMCEEKNPVILPKDSHVSSLLVRHHHEQVRHQGRHLTEGAVRAAGLWILCGKRLINSVLHKCVICRKLRGRLEEQRMADLPPEHLKVCPPFTYVGLDVFEPCSVVTRCTRGGQAESKWWAMMFSCLSSRAVHIEMIESMDTSSCINALRRFFPLRGHAKELQSDCGTNFIGASKELEMDNTGYLSKQGCSWNFRPPHASHMGGSWERMIGVASRILDSMLLQQKSRLTHEVLSTLMAEITAIINARPLLPVSTGPHQPFILSPAMLLTQKSGVPPPPGDFTDKDLFTKQWRQVQALANQFWARWGREYFLSLQQRQKWTVACRNLQVGDLVLLRDKQTVRNYWPMAIATATFPGKDGHMRKVEIKTTNQGDTRTFLRPVAEAVLLRPKD
ncbi:alcohol-forming fatty acyl-CoA reductase [Sarotherodon galilaeus]